MNLRYCIRCEETFFCEDRPCPVCGKKLYYFGRERVSLSPLNILIEYDKRHPYNPLKDYKGHVVNETFTPEMDSSILECEDVLKHNSEEPNALYFLGMTYFSRNEIKKAQRYLEPLVSLEPSDSRPYRYLADTYILEDKADKAIPHLLTVIKHQPDNWEIHDLLGRAYLKNGDSKKALKSFVSAYKSCKDSTRKEGVKTLLKQLTTQLEDSEK